MIISVSRRTDIPACYSEWFFNRLDEGHCMVSNPFNPKQIRKVGLTPDEVDGFVFWTKDPEPMLSRISELEAYNYYFTFTLTPYGPDIEPGLRDKGCLLQTFRELARKIGSDKVIWRYDPILVNERYSKEFHKRTFAEYASELNGFTNKCVISFVDSYRGIGKALRGIGAAEINEEDIHELAASMGKAALDNKMELATCCEAADLSQYGITHNKCIDAGLMSRIAGREIKPGKDRNQREGCGCDASVDIGAYDTCPKGCLYCYANHSKKKLDGNLAVYDPKAVSLAQKSS